MIRLVRAELLKLRTTHLWWIFALVLVFFTAIALLANSIEADFILSAPAEDLEGVPPEQAAEIEAMRSVAAQAAKLYTSGQFFGLLLVMVLGALMITNEYHHQTATATFLTTPRRTLVILGKLVTAVLLGGAFWLITTVIGVTGGAIFLNTQGYGPQFDDSSVLRAVALNLLGYAIWTILGVGLGVLIRNQIAAVVVTIVAYFIGFVAQGIIGGLAVWLEQDWLEKAVVLLPSAASQLMISGTELPGSPPQWVGAAVLVGYGAVAGVIGTLITRTRDIT